MGLLESIRRWIDGEGADPLAQADEQAKPRRVWEEFLVNIAREVESAMQREMFTPPGGPTYIPREYLIYLSNDDDKEWQGEKRRGLEQGLFHVLSERARELSGTNQIAAKSFAVELRVDGTLAKGEFRVQPIWDETEAGKTSVTPRPGVATATTRATADLASEIGPEGVTPVHEDAIADPADTSDGGADGSTDADQTQVRARVLVLYSLEIWRAGVRQSVVPISKPEISIGRGSKSVTVDIPLKGDAEISRLHVSLTRDDAGRFWLTPKGRNATLINGRELPREVRSPVAPDEKIGICEYTLRIQPEWNQTR